MLASFKVKLVATFLALCVVPLAAAFWAFTEVADRSITSGVDDRLEAGLSAAQAAFQDELDNALRAAQRVGRDDAFQAALARRDRDALARLLPKSPPLRLETDAFAVGRLPAFGVETSVSLVGPGNRSATLVAAVPLTDALAERLHARSGLTAPDELVILDSRRRVGAASGPGLTGEARLVPGRIGLATIGDAEFRGVGAPVTPQSEALLAAVTPRDEIVAERRAVVGRILVGLLGSLLLIGCVAYVAGRSIVRPLARLADAANSIAAGRLGERVDVHGRDEFAALAHAFNDMAAQLEARLEDLEDERRRLRDANVRFGEALAATLDPDQLRRVIVETAVEATQAAGGRLVADGDTYEAGDPDAEGERLEYELRAGRHAYGRLVLVGDAFDVEERMTAASLTGQAVVALENARLHRVAERRARVDSLTGLANRRRADEALEAELARSDRLGDPTGLILLDVDDFKAVNDRYGHPTGDEVLRAVAATLRDAVRQIDTAARWGGEEFAVVLPATDLDGASQLAERLRAALAEREIVGPDDQTLRVTASFGVAASLPGSTPERLVETADDALYRAKRAGKNRVYAGSIPVTSL